MTLASHLPSASPDPGAAQALAVCIQRLEELVDSETAALAEHREFDLEESNRRKSRALLEITRITRALPVSAIEAGVRSGIGRLREKLQHNRDLLQIHITAVREVADLLAQVTTEMESDGTYSARLAGRYQC